MNSEDQINKLAWKLYVNENEIIYPYDIFMLSWTLSDPYIERAKRIMRKRKLKKIFYDEKLFITNKTNFHQSKTNEFYYICERCGCNIMDIENYCPRCGRKINETHRYYHSKWKNIKVNNGQ